MWLSFIPYLSEPDMPSLRDWVYADVFSGSFEGVVDANYTMQTRTSSDTFAV